MFRGPSQRPVVAHLLRRPNLAVPSDQRKLLEQHDSWPLALGDKLHPPPLFPPHLFDAVRQAYVTSRDAAHGAEAPRPNASIAQREEQIGTQDTWVSPTASHRRRLRASNPPQNHARARAALVAAREVAASRSVAYNTEAPPSGASATEEHEPKAGQDASNSPPASEIISWPETPPQTRLDAPAAVGQTPRQPTSPPRRRVDNEPSSSGEIVMSVEIPRALPQVSPKASSANTVASLLSDGSLPLLKTPIPCAQPAVIPNTSGKDAKPAQHHQGGRRHRTKLVVFTSSPLKIAASAMTPKRMPSIASRIGDVSSTFSGSVIPATCQSPPTSNRTAAPVVTASPSCQHPKKPAYPASSAGQSMHMTASSTPPKPDLAKSSGLDSGPAGKTAGGATRQHVKPLEAYAATYPDYVTCHGGNLWNFVRACLYVDYLQNKRMLRDCLYDDFIRAFSGQYLHYVASAGPGQEPLVAIQWYNNQEGMPLYTSNVVTRKTLADVFDAYSDEVKMARGLIDKQDGEGRPERRERRASPGGQWPPQPVARTETEQARRTHIQRTFSSCQPGARHPSPPRRAFSDEREFPVPQTAITSGRDGSEQGGGTTQARRTLPAHWHRAARQLVEPQRAEPTARQSSESRPATVCGGNGAKPAERPTFPVHGPRAQNPRSPSWEPEAVDATVVLAAATPPQTSPRAKTPPIRSYFDRLSVRARLAARKRGLTMEEEVRQGEGSAKRKRLSSGPGPPTASSRSPSPC